MATGTCSISEETLYSVKSLVFQWTANSTGTVTSESTAAHLSGECLMLATVPGTATLQPSDQYDVAVLDSNSLDILTGSGANRSNVNTEYVRKANLGAVNDSLTLSITNAGDSKTGAVYLFIR